MPVSTLAARATLVLPDEWALRPTPIRTSSGSEQQVHNPVSAAYCTRTPRTPPPSSSRGAMGAQESPPGGQGRRSGNVSSSTWSSVTGRRSEEGSRVEKRGAGKREGAWSPRRPARGSRVIKTSRGFAETVQRVFKVGVYSRAPAQPPCVVEEACVDQR